MGSSSSVAGTRASWAAAHAFTDGCRRVLDAPAVLGGVFLVTVLLALPLALVVRDAIAGHLGRSLSAEAVAEGVDYDWWQEFLSQASGLATTFTPSVIGFATVLDNVSGLVDRQPKDLAIIWVLAAYLMGWLFLSGGIVDRYARQRRLGAHAFFSACGGHWLRLIRLAIIAGLTYWLLFSVVHQWLFDDWFATVNRGLAVERTALFWRAAAYAIFGALLVAANTLFDFTRIRIVIEDRRSVVLSVVAALRFLGRNPGHVAALYAFNATTFLGIVGLWLLLAPGIGGTGLSMWLAFAGSQVYLLARLAVKLLFVASETALFQHSLAHAAYVSTQTPQWPEAPVVEPLKAG